MANVALRCTNPACSARGKVQTTKTCALCGRPTAWSVLRAGPAGQGPIGPFYTTPMPLKRHEPAPRAPGDETRTCTNPTCPRYHLAQDDPYCGACGNATVVATTL